MQPRSVTLTSSGSTPWQIPNWNGLAPFNIAVTLQATTISSFYQLDWTLGDPTGVYPTPPLTVYQTSQLPGSSTITSTQSGTQIGVITTPVGAFRLTSGSTTINATLTWLQSGIG